MLTEIRMHGISADRAENTQRIQFELDRMLATDMRVKLVLPPGFIPIHAGQLSFLASTDYSARDAIVGWGGKNEATVLDAFGTGPALHIGTTAGGNFRRLEVSGICFRRNGLKMTNLGYGTFTDICGFGGTHSYCLETVNSFPTITDSWFVHSYGLLKQTGGVVDILNSGIGEDMGPVLVNGGEFVLRGVKAHSLKSHAWVQGADVPTGEKGDKPWILAIGGALVDITNSRLRLHVGLKDASGNYLPDEEQDARTPDCFIRTNGTRDISIATSRIYTAGAKSFANVRYQHVGTEIGATWNHDSGIVTSDRAADFEYMRALYPHASVAYKDAYCGAVIETKSPETFKWGNEAVANGLVTTKPVRLNTD